MKVSAIYVKINIIVDYEIEFYAINIVEISHAISRRFESAGAWRGLSELSAAA